MRRTLLLDLLTPALGAAEAAALLETVALPPAPAEAAIPSRAVIALALALRLFHDLLERVPPGRAYVAEQRRAGRRIVFDHGALRTVAAPCGALPAGRAAFARLLEPLGYRRAAVYPLERLGMTGHAYTHADFPETLPQYFVSELHPERFSPDFQAAVARVVGSSRDPLSPAAAARLAALAEGAPPPAGEAAALVAELAGCFARQHPLPSEADYELLLAESAEMAWIATEGNQFNHATDRVPAVESLAGDLRRRGFAMKERIEISASGRVRQTALRAVPVERLLGRRAAPPVCRPVPGSFFEFISRDRLPGGADSPLDLGFDSGNAQGIFRMTAAFDPPS